MNDVKKVQTMNSTPHTNIGRQLFKYLIKCLIFLSVLYRHYFSLFSMISHLFIFYFFLIQTAIFRYWLWSNNRRYAVLKRAFKQTKNIIKFAHAYTQLAISSDNSQKITFSYKKFVFFDKKKWINFLLSSWILREKNLFRVFIKVFNELVREIRSKNKNVKFELNSCMKISWLHTALQPCSWFAELGIVWKLPRMARDWVGKRLSIWCKAPMTCVWLENAQIPQINSLTPTKKHLKWFHKFHDLKIFFSLHSLLKLHIFFRKMRFFRGYQIIMVCSVYVLAKNVK